MVRGVLFLRRVVSTLLIQSGYSKSSDMLMALFNGIRLVLLLVGSNNVKVLIMRILSAPWSNPRLFVCYCLLLLLVDGLFDSWMFRMPFFMVFWRRRFICASLLVLLILLARSICVAW